MNGRTGFRWLLAAFFVAAGVNHFRDTGFYVPMMPAWLPWPVALIRISGAAEILGGVGLLVPPVRRAAGWGLIVLLVAVFPANLHLALDPVPVPGLDLPAWVRWARLPLQAVFAAWAWWVAAARPRENPRA
jgi:uncharacterized membrane protein